MEWALELKESLDLKCFSAIIVELEAIGVQSLCVVLEEPVHLELEKHAVTIRLYSTC